MGSSEVGQHVGRDNVYFRLQQHFTVYPGSTFGAAHTCLTQLTGEGEHYIGLAVIAPFTTITK